MLRVSNPARQISLALFGEVTSKARRIVNDLFAAFVADPRLLPPQYQEMAAMASVQRATADYIAGMTDRYSMKEHRRLFSVGES